MKNYQATPNVSHLAMECPSISMETQEQAQARPILKVIENSLGQSIPTLEKPQ